MRNIETDLLPMCVVPASDAEKFVAWMTPEQRQKTDFDKSVIGYPRACMTRVQQDQKTIVLVPVHPVLMLESLARESDLTDSQLVLALISINEKLQQVMQDSGMAEVFFQTNIERFADICEHSGWEKNLYDPIKGTWLLKKRANFDWAVLLERHNESHNDQSDAEHADTHVAASTEV